MEGLWGKLSRKWVITVLLVGFAIAATVGGIKYYRFKTIQSVLSSPAYQTALGIISLEQYPKLALSREQAQKLLPLVRKLVDNPNVASADGAKAGAMQAVLTPEQKDFIKNVSSVKGFTGVGYQTPKLGLTQEEKDIILPILREIGQKPNPDEAYLAQKATEIKAVLTAAGFRNNSIEKNNDNLVKGMRREAGKGWGLRKKGGKGEHFRVEQQGHGFGKRVSGAYNSLLEILLQKVYS
ncbi:MAG: hypothetical protein ACYC21_07860 [Eubacteriales bacterium]